MEGLSTDTTLNEITLRWPQTLPVLGRYGLDMCCGGAKPMREAAERHGVDPQALLEELLEVLEETSTSTS